MVSAMAQFKIRIRLTSEMVLGNWHLLVIEYVPQYFGPMMMMS